MKREESQKRLETLLNEALVENQPIVEFKDSLAFDITFKLRDMTNFLLDNGISVHYMNEGDICYGIDVCSAPESFDCSTDVIECAKCKYNEPYVREEIYIPYYSDAEFGKTIFATKEEAEAKLKEMLEGKSSDGIRII